MRLFRAVILLCLLRSASAAPESTQVPLSQAQQKFRNDVASAFREVEKTNSGAVRGLGGWLFLPADLRILAAGCFWGGEAQKVSRSPKPELADPTPAIVDFHEQLKGRGIQLLLVPVPPKAAVYSDKISAEDGENAGDPAPYLHRYYEEIRAAGIDVLDVTEVLRKNRNTDRGEVYCKTDTHWSGFGCVLGARAIAEAVKTKLTTTPSQPKEYAAEWKEVVINGDLADLLRSKSEKPESERISIRCVSEKATGAATAPDPASAVLVIGDSHTLVFHDFLAERAGLLDQLALELGFAPDLIGTRGSGATAVRLALYRRSLKDPEYLVKKKVVIWCFAAREFTEASQGWQKLPVAK